MKSLSFCDRCGKQKNVLREFCNGEYHFCHKCTKDWLDLLYAVSPNEGWNPSLFDWWLKHSPYVLKAYNPSKRF